MIYLQTALSQYRNLFFIAYNDEIHVFRPQFPHQTISSKPELVLKLPVSRPGLRGCIDPTRPHAVNHLIIGDMGIEEILVAACDDGDVRYPFRTLTPPFLAPFETCETCRMKVLLARDASHPFHVLTDQY